MCSPQIPLDRRMSTNKMLRLLLACGVVFTTVRMYTMRKATAVQQNGQHCLDTGAARVTGRLVTCTRIHRKKAGNTHGEDVQALKQLIVQAVAYSDHIAIAVDQADGELMQQVSDMVEDCKQIIKKEVPIDVLPVSIWGNFVPALNALLMHAVKINAAVILYTSVELQMSSSQVDSLRDQLTDSTLVVGAQVRFCPAPPPPPSPGRLSGSGTGHAGTCISRSPHTNNGLTSTGNDLSPTAHLRYPFRGVIFGRPQPSGGDYPCSTQFYLSVRREGNPLAESPGREGVSLFPIICP